MRRKDREVTDIEQLLEIIDCCKVCRIAMQDKDGLYIVPLNFGFEYKAETLTLYFHSAKEGRKINAIVEDGSVCFEMDCEHRLIEADEACDYTYSFKSIIGNGCATMVDDSDEKKKALSLIMLHQTGKEFQFNDKMIESVGIFKVVASSFVGKYHK